MTSPMRPAALFSGVSVSKPFSCNAPVAPGRGALALAIALALPAALPPAALAQTTGAGDPLGGDVQPGLRETFDPEAAPGIGAGAGDLPPGEAGGVRRTEPNFGKPRPLRDRRLDYPGRRREAKQPLPRTEPYRTAPVTVRGAYAAPPAPPPPTPYAQPPEIPRKRRPTLDETPYAPLGITAGSLRLFPYVETGFGNDTNANRSPGVPRSSAFNRTEAGIRAQSNWSVHEFRAEVTGGYNKYFNAPEADRPDGTGKLNLRLDATRETKIDLELRGALSTQRPGSPEVNANVVARPAIFTYGATAGVTRTFGRLEATIAALYDRTDYEDGRLSNGNRVLLSRENYNNYGLRGRVGYEITPGIKPFVEVTASTRQRDNPIDASGFARNSNGVAVRAGSTFEITRTLTGEISGGYLNRKYDDARLAELRGPTFDASLIWTATPLTTVIFKAQTAANETTLPGASGYMTRRASVEVNHALLRNLTLGALAQWSQDDYQGVALKQNTLTGTLKAEYALSRSVVVKGSFTHERLKSSIPGNDYTANVYLLGLRLQR